VRPVAPPRQDAPLGPVVDGRVERGESEEELRSGARTERACGRGADLKPRPVHDLDRALHVRHVDQGRRVARERLASMANVIPIAKAKRGGGKRAKSA
jgi:hypothetical protein